jgi:hypothetical protein
MIVDESNAANGDDEESKAGGAQAKFGAVQ